MCLISLEEEKKAHLTFLEGSAFLFSPPSPCLRINSVRLIIGPLFDILRERPQPRRVLHSRLECFHPQRALGPVQLITAESAFGATLGDQSLARRTVGEDGGKEILCRAAARLR